MLLFKKKSVCGASVTRLVLNMIYVRKWFFLKKKLSWRYIPVRCFCENAALSRLLMQVVTVRQGRQCLHVTFLRAVKISLEGLQ